jgi:hypothetical protein
MTIIVVGPLHTRVLLRSRFEISNLKSEIPTGRSALQLILAAGIN